MGFFRMKLEPGEIPRVSAVEFLRSTYGNTWGLGFSEEGLVFGSSANGHPSLFLPIPNRYYERVRGWTPSLLAASIADSPKFFPITDKVRQVDHHGHYSAAAGHALYTARAYPETWWNKTAFVCGPEGHLVGTFVLQPDGAGFVSHSPGNLVASNDEWSAPILAEVGPDGYVWIIDWYNYIVQHNPTPLGFENGKGNAYVTDLRDKTRGRIYRLVADRPTEGFSHDKPLLDPAEPRSMLSALRHPTMFCRLEAQRLLVERGQRDVVPDLLALLADPAVDGLGLNPAVMHALWTLHGLGVIQDSEKAVVDAVTRALGHRGAGVRRVAVTVLPSTVATVERLQEAKILEDSDPQVRLAGLLALADVPATARAGDWLAQSATRPEGLTPWLKDALTAASATHAEFFLSALGSPSTAWGIPETHSSLAGVVAIVAEHAGRSGLSLARRSELLSSMVRMPAPIGEALLSGLVKSWPAGEKEPLPPSAEEGLLAIFGQLSPAARTQVIRLGSLTRSEKLLAAAEGVMRDATRVLENRDASVDERLTAARQLIQLRPDRAESVQALLAPITPSSDPDFVAGLFAILRESVSNQLGEQVMSEINRFTPAGKKQAIRLLLTRTDTTRDLLKGIEKGTLDLAELSVDEKQSLAQHPDKMIAARAAKVMAAGGGLPDPDRAKVLEELLPLTRQVGNVDRGAAAFKTHCSKCHQHGSEGANIGPNLTGMAVHPKSEILLHIVDPSRSVETNYRAYTVTTVDGRVHSGLLAGESKTTIEMVDIEGKRSAIPREDIEEILASKKSFMPEGFEKQMKASELVDLLEFMTARGRFTPLDLRPVASIVSTKGMFTSDSADAERLIFDDWSAKTVDGIPYLLVDPQGDRVPNVVMLKGELGEFPPRMPTSVSLPVGQRVKAIHFLSGVGGWSFPATGKGSVSMIVRLHYADETQEDHELINGVHFADYIRRVDVPGSKLAFMLRGQQIRTFSVLPKRNDSIDRLELIKGPDPTAPVVMGLTVESP
jgi:putative heme-binding domain-containing protein